MSTFEKFHHQITGQPNAPKLVFLHGVMGFSANFRRIAHAFEADYEVLVYDQRGHGRSFHAAPGNYRLTDYASDLREILRELGWQKITLVGHSMGGRVAIHFASQYPDMLTRLVIEDIGPSMHTSRASLITRMLDAIPVPFADKRTAKRWFDTEFLELFKAERKKEGLAAYMYANLSENEQKQGVWRFDEAGIRETVEHGRAFDRWDQIEALRMPTLLVHGEWSTDLPRELFEKVLCANRTIEGVEIKNCGHWIHSDQPDVFIQVLKLFFAGAQQDGFEGTEVVTCP